MLNLYKTKYIYIFKVYSRICYRIGYWYKNGSAGSVIIYLISQHYMHATVDTTIIRVDAHLLVADWKLVVLLLQVMLGPLGFWWFLLRQFWRPKDLCDLKFTYLFAHKDDFLISKYFSFTLHQLYHRQHHYHRRPK